MSSIRSLLAAMSYPWWSKKHKHSRLVDQTKRIADVSAAANIEPGWKPLVKAGACVTAVCLLVNVVTLIWVHARPPPNCPTAPDDESKTLYCGSCTEVQNIKTWSHVAINVCSTLILATSTTCMQVLSAPTRAEIDASHRKGTWMDVDVLSFGNLSRIDRKRVLLYLILLATSIPVHFLYNSVILSTQGVYDSLVLLGTPQFIANATIDDTSLQNLRNLSENRNQVPLDYYNFGYLTGSGADQEWIRLNYSTVFLPSQNDIRDVVSSFKMNGSYQNLSTTDCLRRFTSSSLTQTPNVLIVTSPLQNSSDQLIDLIGTGALEPPHWPCFSADYMYNSSSDLLNSCDLADWAANPGNGSQPQVLPWQDGQITRPLPAGFWTVDYCLVQNESKLQGQCSVIFSTPLISVIIFVNLAKLCVIVHVVRYLDFQPLVTVGDAISSFMHSPDPLTEGMNVHSDASIKSSFKAETVRVLNAEGVGYDDLKRIMHKGDLHKAHMHPSSLTTKGRHWVSAVSTERWIQVAIFFLILYLLAAVCFGIAAHAGPLSTQDLGNALNAPTLGLSGSFLSQVMLANLPQFLISFFYVNYMGLLTVMLVAAELSDFTKEAKAMRVSPPKRGQQRSSYFLQVPFRYSLPVLITMIALHWFTSEAFFVVRVTGFDVVGKLSDAVLVHDIGYSTLGILLVLVSGGVLCLFPIALAFRRYPSGMPLIVNNSLAIGIACHPFPDEPQDGHERPLKYGFVRSKVDPSLTRIGFSAAEVERVTGDEKIHAPRCLSAIMYPDLDSVGECSLNSSATALHASLRKRL